MVTLTDNTRGTLLMIGSMAAFTLNDACMKALSTSLPLAQSIFLRGLLTTALMLGLAWGLGKLNLRMSPRDRLLVALRTLTEVGSAYFFISALYNMPFANATAILQALPLSITLAGAVFLGEAVGWRRMAAILIGFAGVLMIVRPGFDGFNAYSLYALTAVVLVTARDLLSRRLSRKVETLTVALINAVAVTVVFGIASTTITWQPVSAHTALLLCGASVLIIGGYVFSVSAMRVGEIAVIAPFRYTALLWALILGFVVFGEWPSILTLIGSAIIVMTGVYTFSRERSLAKAASRQNLTAGTVDTG